MICPRCESEYTERYRIFVEQGMEVEYSIRCLDCGEKVGTYAYGSWFPNEDYEE